MTTNTNYSEYDALHVMRTTGPARLDSDGLLIDSGEYVAALYESYAADLHEGRRSDQSYRSHIRYADAAERAAEDLHYRDAAALAQR